MKAIIAQIAGRIGPLMALLVMLSALVAYPSPRIPLASIRHAEATIGAFSLTEIRGVSPTAASTRAALDAPNPAAPEPFHPAGFPSVPFDPTQPRAASPKPWHALAPPVAGGMGRLAHPPRAPPLA
ncbi:hypothetical protein FHS00_003455 [Limimaricola variabilis]|uniref:Uncharacterized protein n=1 Tax=Limimaricola variabilis TaxID=1492771 RepID=A0ABR6HTW7_9RHOB|nr:hypothetical protein [Limimaricola variabilis]